MRNSPVVGEFGEDEQWMLEALAEARMAAQEGEVPIGAIAVLEGIVIARNHNRSIQSADPTAHAEVLVLREAAAKLGNYRLTGLTIYTTIEPCAMCAGALIWARVKRLVFGAWDEKGGAAGSRIDILAPGLFNHPIEVRSGVLAGECRKPLQDFFGTRRSRPEVTR